jgi:hypothetical protein
MPSQNVYDTHIDTSRDMLGYTPAATPSADAWLASFTRAFTAQANGQPGARALMSGLRFVTADFMAEIAALPPVALRLPPLPGGGTQAIYTATQGIIRDIYENQIQRQAEPAAILEAVTQAMPGLLAAYHGSPTPGTGRRD